eukprot:6209988-Pleurochrysis_carterae.AAC.1
MPVVALAPPARCPFIAPFFICFRSRAFRIGRLSARFLTAFLFTSHCERVCSAWVGFEFATHVANLGVAQHASCGDDRESKIAYAGI